MGMGMGREGMGVCTYVCKCVYGGVNPNRFYLYLYQSIKSKNGFGSLKGAPLDVSRCVWRILQVGSKYSSNEYE